jgi:rubrerythrin
MEKKDIFSLTEKEEAELKEATETLKKELESKTRDFHEFQCLGCGAIWLMDLGSKPKYCPNCGSQFGEFIKLKQDEGFKS